MNAEQKRAWLGVATFVACVVGYLVLWPFLGPVPALGVLGLLGVNGFAGLIGRGEPVDERDRNIVSRATGLGGMASYLAFVIGCMGTWFVVYLFQHGEKVSVHVLSLITAFGFIAFYLTRCVAVLVLYGRHVEADNA